MTIFTKKSFGTLSALILFFFLTLATIATAEGSKYTPLVGIPGITTSGAKSIGEYLNAIYILLISVGGLIGVVKISMAGVKYSMSDIVTDKGEAKKDIVGVLLGLAILLIPAIVLETIYPNLTNLDVLKSAPKVKLEPSRGGAGGGGNTPANPTDPSAIIKQCPYGGTEEGLDECPTWCADLNGTLLWLTAPAGSFPQATCSYKK